MTRPQINRFPTRYEPLVNEFGDSAKNTFVRQENDLSEIARLLKQQLTAAQSKLCFIYAPTESGAGKTTFIQSLDLFLPDQVETVHRIGPEHTLDLIDLSTAIREIPAPPKGNKITVVNVDGHESFVSDDEAYRRFLVQLNNVLRNRSDILILWPTNDRKFADKVIEIMKQVGGLSPDISSADF